MSLVVTWLMNCVSAYRKTNHCIGVSSEEMLYKLILSAVFTFQFLSLGFLRIHFFYEGVSFRVSFFEICIFSSRLDVTTFYLFHNCTFGGWFS